MIDKIIKDFLNRIPIKTLSEVYEKSYYEIEKIIERYCDYYDVILDDDLYEELNLISEEMYIEKLNGVTLKDIAKKYGSSQYITNKRIEKYCKEHNIETFKFSKQNKVKKTLPLEEIHKSLEEGKSYEELGRKYGCSGVTIKHRHDEYCRENNLKQLAVGRAKIDLQLEEIHKSLQEGKSYEELGRKYGCSAITIRCRYSKYCKENNLKQSSVERTKITLPLEEIHKSLEEGRSYEELGRKYGCSDRTIKLRHNKYCKENNLKQLKYVVDRKPKIDLPLEEIHKSLQEGKSYEELARKYSCSVTTIWCRHIEYCKENNLEQLKSVVVGRTKMTLPLEEIHKSLEEGKSYEELGRKYDCCGSTIKRRHDEYCKENNLKQLKHVVVRKPKIDLPLEEIHNSLEAGDSYRVLGRKYGCSGETIRCRHNEYCRENNLKQLVVKKPKIDLPLEEIHKSLQEGKSYEELGRKYGYSGVTIKYRYNEYCKENNLKQFKHIVVKEPKIDLLLEEIHKSLQEGKSYKELGRKYGCSDRTIRRRYNEYCEENNLQQLVIRKPKIDLPLEEIHKSLEEGRSYGELAIKYDCSAITIKCRHNKYCKENNLKQLGIGRKKMLLPLEEIHKSLEEGKSYEELARKYGCSVITIKRRHDEYCKENNIQQLSVGRPKTTLSLEEIYNSLQEGKSYEELAIKYGCSDRTIRRRYNEYCKANNLKQLRDKDVRNPKINLPLEEIHKSLEEGKSYEELGREYGCSGQTIKCRHNKYCKENNLKQLKHIVVRKPKIDLPLEEIHNSLQAGKSYEKLGRKYGCSTMTIKRRHDEYCKENNLSIKLSSNCNKENDASSEDIIYNNIKKRIQKELLMDLKQLLLLKQQDDNKIKLIK